MEFTAEELWARVLEMMRGQLQEQTYRTWLSGTVAQSLTESEILIEVPSDFHVEWIEGRFGGLLAEALQQLLGRPLEVIFHSTEEASPLAIPAIEVVSPTVPTVPAVRAAEATASVPRPALNERYVFDRFVVGNNNELAAAACRAVAESPGRVYNPLFLYGGVGLGKTHLMHAIGNAIHGSDPTRRISYVPAEEFTNDLVASIQAGTMAEFRRRYRQMDLLLVDDIQFLKGKEATQEEFFHTFNALHDARKQIVVTSDRPPRDIPGLAARLVSRFEWGMVADIKPPDYETRLAILLKQAVHDHLTLEPDVLDFIARSCTSSVRELEGAVIKLLAYSSLMNQEITVEVARTGLKGTFGSTPPPGAARSSPERIREIVARRFDVREEALSSKRRTRDLTVPRQVAMYLIKDLLEYSLVQIGNLFGGRDHSTVIHSIRKVEEALATDDEFFRMLEDIRDEINRPE
jgi:chromosomal replication initiator protein